MVQLYKSELLKMVWVSGVAWVAPGVDSNFAAHKSWHAWYPLITPILLLTPDCHQGGPSQQRTQKGDRTGRFIMAYYINREVKCSGSNKSVCIWVTEQDNLNSSFTNSIMVNMAGKQKVNRKLREVKAWHTCLFCNQKISSFQTPFSSSGCLCPVQFHSQISFSCDPYNSINQQSVQSVQ